MGFRVTSYQLWLFDCEQDLGNSAVSLLMKTPPAVLELLQVERQAGRQADIQAKRQTDRQTEVSF